MMRIVEKSFQTLRIHQDSQHYEHQTLKKNCFSKSKKDRRKFLMKGFTLLELMIALSILVVIWGSSAHLLIRMNQLITNILHQREVSLALDATKQFERDVYTLLKQFNGGSEKLSFENLLGEVTYEFRGKSVYRKLLQNEQLVLKGVQDCQWRFLSKGKWFEIWNQDDFPDAILWEFQLNDELFRMIYPVRFEK